MNRNHENTEHNFFLRIPPRRCVAIESALSARLACEIRSRERRKGKRYVHKIRDDDVVGRPRCLRKSFDKKGKACYVSSSTVALETAIKSKRFGTRLPRRTSKSPRIS